LLYADLHTYAYSIGILFRAFEEWSRGIILSSHFSFSLQSIRLHRSSRNLGIEARPGRTDLHGKRICPWSLAQGFAIEMLGPGRHYIPKNPDTPLETFISARPRGAMVEAL